MIWYFFLCVWQPGLNHFWAVILESTMHQLTNWEINILPLEETHFLLWDVYKGSNEEIRWHVYQ